MSQSSTGQITTTTSRESLLDSEGTGVVVVLAVPVALVAIAVTAQGSSWRRRARCLAGALLLVGSLLGAMSVGLPYLPAAVALLVAGLRTPPGPVSASRPSRLKSRWPSISPVRVKPARDATESDRVFAGSINRCAVVNVVCAARWSSSSCTAAGRVAVAARFGEHAVADVHRDGVEPWLLGVVVDPPDDVVVDDDARGRSGIG